jgi:hypothetical protein
MKSILKNNRNHIPKQTPRSIFDTLDNSILNIKYPTIERTERW